jgi:hypothetical protein
MIDAHLNAATEPAARNIASQRQHGRPVEPGASYAGGQIGGSRTDGRSTDTRSAGQVSNHRCHKPCRRFARRQDEFNGTSAQRFDQRKDRTAGYAENPAHLGFLQHADNDIAVVHQRT